MMQARNFDIKSLTNAHVQTRGWLGRALLLATTLVAASGANCPDDKEHDDGDTCTAPMPGYCEEDAECGACGTCAPKYVIDMDDMGACSCRTDLAVCHQSFQDQPLDPYLMYHVESGVVIWIAAQVNFEHPSWAYCSDGNGPAACECSSVGDLWELVDGC